MVPQHQILLLLLSFLSHLPQLSLAPLLETPPRYMIKGKHSLLIETFTCKVLLRDWCWKTRAEMRDGWPGTNGPFDVLSVFFIFSNRIAPRFKKIRGVFLARKQYIFFPHVFSTLMRRFGVWVHQIFRIPICFFNCFFGLRISFGFVFLWPFFSRWRWWTRFALAPIASSSIPNSWFLAKRTRQTTLHEDSFAPEMTGTFSRRVCWVGPFRSQEISLRLIAALWRQDTTPLARKLLTSC